MANDYRIEKWRHPYPPNPAMLRLELEGEGFRVINMCSMPESTYGMRKHENEQSHWVISGSIEITVGKIAYLLTAGDRGRMPANTYHTSRVVGDEPVHYLIGERTTLDEKELRVRNSEILIDNMMLMEKIISESLNIETDEPETAVNESGDAEDIAATEEVENTDDTSEADE